ncbi:ribonuclease D [Olsenella massiliensis]|uniref:ribonuclease D n=1 Tax=Olsenella massiliensis TaxID=1622075 RepID=UPI00071DD79E|nr:ribonuclease D [Olsenella massiliensis]
MYISDAAKLTQFCERAGRSGVIAVDTEFIREKTYHPKLCLVQVGFGRGDAFEGACIDPLLVTDLTPLVSLLGDRTITKVFHACSQDLEVIQDSLGCEVAPVFDTQLAAAFLGLRQQIGYGALVEELCGVRLPKAESLTDWSRRPLDDEQLSYAEDDVRFLPGIYELMMGRLSREERLSWVMPEMEELADPRRYRRDPLDAFVHLRRASSLTRRQLAVAREVCAWREREASRRDLPRKWVASDELLLEASKRAPRSVERLRRIRGAESLGERDAAALVASVARGLACDPQDYPQKTRHERPSQDMEGVLDLMYATLRIVADRQGIAPQLVATKDDLIDFASGRRDARLAAAGWRHDLVGGPLSRLLAGEMGLTVKDGRVELL